MVGLDELPELRRFCRSAADPPRACAASSQRSRRGIYYRSRRWDDYSRTCSWLELPAVKWAVPIPLLLAIAPVVWWFFRGTWRELDAEALALPARRCAARGEIDYRPMVALTLVALILTLQEYYGRRDFYDAAIHALARAAATRAHPGGFIEPRPLRRALPAPRGGALTRIGGYLLPLAVWRLFFRRDSLLDFGLRARGFRAHAWIYALCVVVMVPVLLLVSRQPDFADYYPMYKQAGRSWLDFVDLGGRSTSPSSSRWRSSSAASGCARCASSASGAIWSMVVPYCMIHYGKPYLEALGRGDRGRRARARWRCGRAASTPASWCTATVAILMDVLALYRRHALARAAHADELDRHLTFLHWRVSSGSPGRWRSRCWPRRCGARGRRSRHSFVAGAAGA